MFSIDVENRLHKLGFRYRDPFYCKEDALRWLRENHGVIVSVLPVGSDDDNDKFLGYVYGINKITENGTKISFDMIPEEERYDYNEVLKKGIEMAVREFLE